MCQEIARIRQIANIPKSPQVGRVSLNSVKVMVSAEQNGESGILQAEAEPASAAKQINRDWSRRTPDPIAYRCNVRGLRNIEGAR
jgi:hypothetical protein